MTNLAIACNNVSKRYPYFLLDNINLSVPEGSVMGMIEQSSGEINVLGQPMPKAQISVKHDVGYLAENMRMYERQSIGFHMDFMQSIYPNWDTAYAERLLKQFDLVKEQTAKGLSHGQRVKAFLVLVLAHRPKLLLLDEPTTGLDPVARHEFLNEMMQVIEDESRPIVFSSHNTLDIEQISDSITFINGGKIIGSRDKESFLDSWKRTRLEVSEQAEIPALPVIVEVKRSGHLAVITTGNFNDEIKAQLETSDSSIQAIERMTLEEIFLASVDNNETGQQEKAA